MDKKIMCMIAMGVTLILLFTLTSCKTEDTNKNEAECSTNNECAIGGCSGTICQPSKAEPIFSTCEYKPEYECYKTIRCSCIENKCQWKKDSVFDRCVEEKSKEEYIPIV